MQTRRYRFLLGGGLALGLSACAPSGDEPMTFEEAPVSALDPLLEDALPNEMVATEAKADETLPARYDLLSIQSPVRSQGRRGTCTIFATNALMESLYMREGTIAMPDFSEQFLQWSSKVEHRRFTTSEGSNPEANLGAITRYGIVAESAWPYEAAAWTATNDPACGMPEAMRPVRCFTNGEPPATALMAQRYTLPAHRQINSRASSIQSYLVNNRLPVVVSGTFYYQAWSHGGTMLRTNADARRRGIVTYPSAEDRADSMMRRAGHGILIVGYDREMRAPRIDAMGNPVMNAMGQPETEQGFYLFKNSWGGSWATEQVPGTTEHPGGFGWISMRYVEEYMTAYVSGLPRVVQREVCDDRVDNDRNGRIDCMDTACASAPACQMPAPGGTTATVNMAIPDNNATGISSTINVTEPGQIASLGLDVDISHTYRGDLTIRLEHAGRTVTVVQRQGAGEDNIREAFSLADFNGLDATGAWRLTVVDSGRGDLGTLNTWGLRITRCTGACGGMETTRSYSNTMSRPIPDNSATGVASEITSSDAGSIRRMTVTVNINHAFPADLEIALTRVGGRETVLFSRQDAEGPSFTRTFTVDAYADQPIAGTWRLIVRDRAASDTGSITSWSMDVTTR